MQRAMVDDLYRKEIEKGEAPDGAWMQAVGLSEGDAARIRDDVQAEAAAKEAKAAEEAAEVSGAAPGGGDRWRRRRTRRSRRLTTPTTRPVSDGNFAPLRRCAPPLVRGGLSGV